MTYLTSIVLFTIAYVVYVSSSITPKPNNVENSPGKWSNILDIQVAMETDGTSVNLKSVINGNRKSISTNFDKCSNNSKIWNQDEVSPLVARSTNDGFDDSNLSTKLDFLKAEVNTIKNALNDLQNENRKFSINTNPELCMKKKTSLGVHHNSYTSTLVNRSSYPKNCREIQKKGNNVTGIYEIFPTNSKAPFPVICDMEIKGGGWTTIQKRFDGSQDFTLGWRDYKFGFGDLDGEFWLGLENIYALTGFEIAELLVEIADRNNVFAYAHYGTFAVSPEPEGYELKHLSGFSGDAGDSLTYSLGQKFSTKDLDYTYNCVATYPGGWWYKDCHISNLNGKHINVDLPSKFKYQGVHWKTFRSHEYCHSKSRMFVRPAK